MRPIPRSQLQRTVVQRLRSDPIVMLLGPRQCGKTTLAHSIATGRRSVVLDLENPADRARLQEPMTALRHLRGLVVIDEAQLQASLFPVLRVLADRRPLPARFLLLGSVSPQLARDVSETLAGRVAIVPMGGFELGEVGAKNMRTLWLRGGFPRAFLARGLAASDSWRQDFVQTFLERDLLRIGVNVAAASLRRLWLMAAHHHGQVLNSSELGRSLGESHQTIRRHLELLAGAFVIRLLPPWFENVGKRQVKAPKLYVRDSGLLHTLLGIRDGATLESHPKLGASWEGFALEEILRVTGDRDAYFWGSHAGAELDLLIHRGARRYGVEFKYADAPALTKSMHVARTDLGIEHLFVVHPGDEEYLLADWATALGLPAARERLQRARSR